jgi:glutathione synthase/RimK-type ligase-like ATP-grasp enzyme
VSEARPRVALATYERAPDLAPDDRPLASALSSLGVEPVAVVWSDLSADWESLDLIVIRSCWDYHLRLAEFNAWLDRLVKMGVPVLNSATLIRWNADKRYLLDLTALGVPTVPTLVVSVNDGERVWLETITRGWRQFVLKPTVSASGYETHLFEHPLDESARATIERVTSRGESLVQPFIEEVSRNGELSFTFIDGEYSHATLKTARSGEFRVQTDHGGKTEPCDAPQTLVRAAARAIAALPETPLYARVDAVEQQNALVLMELELIEPNLFLEYRSGVAERLAAAIVARLNR